MALCSSDAIELIKTENLTRKFGDLTADDNLTLRENEDNPPSRSEP
jgi:hypothetical protein